MNAPAPRQLETMIDTDAIDRYVDVVFGYLEGQVPVRLFSETGTPERDPHAAFHEPAKLASALKLRAPQAAGQSRGLYVVPGTVAKAGSAKASDIIETGVVLVDLDHGNIDTARDHLVRHVGEPTLEIASGGMTPEGQQKLHLYWKLTEAASGADLERATSVRAAIADKVGGDTSFKSIHQPIRVAGTVHGKNGRRAPVRLIADRPREYELNDLEEAVALMPALTTDKADDRTKPGHGAVSRPTAKELATKRVRSEGRDGVTRFDALSSVIGHWIRNHRIGVCSLDEARAAVEDHNIALIDPPWTDERLDREFDALLKRDIEKHGAMPVRESHTPKCSPTSEDALAAELVKRHGASWRFVAVWRSWFAWSGTKWRHDEVGGIRELARQVCREASLTIPNPSDARRVASSKTIEAVVRIASADPRIATRTDDWDAHPMLLNTPSGIVDLRTGEPMPHDPELLISQMTAAAPGAGCPRWHAFLDEITGGDGDLQAYLARLAGYCLTGSTGEQVFAFLHGAGANGKSVFLQTLRAVMGDYAATATLDAFMSTRAQRHLSELAGLRAARLVLVPETEAGQSWAEARIKMVTGGERIRANFMYRDHFEFTPQFKLVVAGNHRPALSNVDEAMRRRLHLVPFTVTIPPERRDGDYGEKLLKERDGILGWMLNGCAEWHRIGLAPPEIVQAAAESYLAEEDVLAHWIEECCSTGAAFRATAKALYGNWAAWANAAGHDVGSQKSLGEALRARGYTAAKVNGARGWNGIAPRSPGGGEGSQ